jgi:hypothetical protein
MTAEAIDTIIGPQGEPPPFARFTVEETPVDVAALGTARWRELIRQICAVWKVDAIRVEAHMLLESGGVTPPNPSPSGAVGLMQIMPKYWRELCAAVCKAHGVSNDMQSWLIPKINIEIGVRELKHWIETKCGGSGDGGSCAYFTGRCTPEGRKDPTGTSDYEYVATIQRNMKKVRADIGGGPQKHFSQGDQIEVISGPVNLRASAGLASAVVDKLATGTVLIVNGGPTELDGHAWYQVQKANGSGGGWIAGQLCRRVRFLVGDVVEVVNGPLNVRAEPGLSSAVWSKLPTGAKVTVSAAPKERDGYTWYPHMSPSGSFLGWIAGEFCQRVM